MRSARTGKRHPARLKWLVAGVAVLAATTAGLFAARQRFSPAAPPVTTGTMTVNTDPPGAEVEVDGTARGQSPMSAYVARGRYIPDHSRAWRVAHHSDHHCRGR